MVHSKGSPHAPDRIAQYSRNGPWTHECCIEVVYLYVGSGSGLEYCNYCYYYYYYYYYYYVVSFLLSFFGEEYPSIAGLSVW